MRTLFLVRDPERTRDYVEVLGELDFRVDVRMVLKSDVGAWTTVDYEIVIIDRELGLERVRELCHGFAQAPDRAASLVVVFGDPSDEREADELVDAGAHLCITSEQSSFKLHARLLRGAARWRGRVRRVLAELHESEERYRTVVTALDEGVIVQAKDGTVTALNPSAARILHLTEEEARARHWRRPDWRITRRDGSEVLHEDLPSIVTLRTGEPVRGCVLGMHDPKGETVWISVNSQPVRDDPVDTVPASVVTSITDITERRRSEDAFRAVLERAPDGVLIHREGRALFVNRRWAELLGQDDPSALVGLPVLNWVPPRYRAQIAERVRLRDAGQEAPPMNHALLRSDGTEVEVTVFGFPMIYEGRPAAIAYARDLTDQRRLEMQVMAADRLASLGRLAAAVGHEINNPLTYVIGNVQRVAAQIRAQPMPAELSHAGNLLDDALEGAERVRHIVRDLKVFSSQEAEERNALDIHRVLDSCARMAENEIRHRARLVKSYAEVPLVFGNESRLAQVFLNLLVNAAQAIPDTPGDHAITVTSRREPDGRVAIQVQDTGIGIEPEFMTRVFEPFFTTKAESGGTGLGLSVCQMLITSQGGSIDITSELGRGTSVTVYLEAAYPVEPARVERSLTSPSSTERQHILVVEDEPALARLLAETLSDDHVVALVASGREAIAYIDGDAPCDIVLCDVMMPGINGIDVLEHARTARPGLERHFVMMTGGAFTPRTSAFIAKNCRVCLEKPFNTRDLLSALERALES